MSIDRLMTLKSENDSKGLEMLTEAGRFKALADRDNNGLKPRAISGFNLFQTPEEVAQRMFDKIPSKYYKDLSILEPSAGLGRLYKVLLRYLPKANYTLVDNNPDCVKELYNISGAGTQIIQNDFLSIEMGHLYNLIIMNPPFKMGTDIKHIKHALRFLKPGGLLVALCYNGVKQNKVLKPIADTWEVLPKNSFKSEGTAAEVVLLTIKGSN